MAMASNSDGPQPNSDGLQPNSHGLQPNSSNGLQQQMASNLVAMASNLIATASNLIAMASNLIATASNLIATTSNLIAMASNLNSDGLQPGMNIKVSMCKTFSVGLDFVTNGAGYPVEHGKASHGLDLCLTNVRDSDQLCCTTLWTDDR